MLVIDDLCKRRTVEVQVYCQSMKTVKIRDEARE